MSCNNARPIIISTKGMLVLAHHLSLPLSDHRKRLVFLGSTIFASAALIAGRCAATLAAVASFRFALFKGGFNFLNCIGGDFFLTHDVSRMFSTYTNAKSLRPFSYSYDYVLFKSKRYFFVV